MVTTVARRSRSSYRTARVRQAIAAARKAYQLGVAGYDAYKSYMKRPAVYQGGRSGSKVRKLGMSRNQRMVTSGSAFGKFKKSRKGGIKKDLYKILGSEMVLEKGGLIDEVSVASLGHSTMPVTQVVRTLARAMWRKIVLDAGMTFSDWEALFVRPSFLFRVEIGVRPTPQGTLVYTGVTAAGSDITHKAWADLVFNLLVNAIPVTGVNYILEQIRFIQPVTLDVEHQVDLTNAMFHFEVKSTLVIQNRTLATGDGAQTTDITNNPVVGRSWDVTGNEMSPAVSKATDGASVADPDSGVITGQLNTSVGGLKYNSAQAYRHATGSSKVQLMPGALKSSVLFSSYKMKVNTFIEKINMYMTNSVTAAEQIMRVPVGKSRLFSFEKLCAIQTQGAETTNVQLGFQCDINLKGFISVPRSTTNRMSGQIA